MTTSLISHNCTPSLKCDPCPVLSCCPVLSHMLSRPISHASHMLSRPISHASHMLSCLISHASHMLSCQCLGNSPLGGRSFRSPRRGKRTTSTPSLAARPGRHRISYRQVRERPGVGLGVGVRGRPGVGVRGRPGVG